MAQDQILRLLCIQARVERARFAGNGDFDERGAMTRADAADTFDGDFDASRSYAFLQSVK